MPDPGGPAAEARHREGLRHRRQHPAGPLVVVEPGERSGVPVREQVRGPHRVHLLPQPVGAVDDPRDGEQSDRRRQQRSPGRQEAPAAQRQHRQRKRDRLERVDGVRRRYPVDEQRAERPDHEDPSLQRQAGEPRPAEREQRDRPDRPEHHPPALAAERVLVAGHLPCVVDVRQDGEVHERQAGGDQRRGQPGVLPQRAPDEREREHEQDHDQRGALPGMQPADHERGRTGPQREGAAVRLRHRALDPEHRVGEQAQVDGDREVAPELPRRVDVHRDLQEVPLRSRSQRPRPDEQREDRRREEEREGERRAPVEARVRKGAPDVGAEAPEEHEQRHRQPDEVGELHREADPPEEARDLEQRVEQDVLRRREVEEAGREAVRAGVADPGQVLELVGREDAGGARERAVLAERLADQEAERQRARHEQEREQRVFAAECFRPKAATGGN